MRVMTYNILLGGDGRLDAIARVIREIEPDAVALLEATENAVAEIASTLEMHSALSESNHPFPRRFGLCVSWLSRSPIRRTRMHQLPELAKSLLEIEIDEVRLFATHLASRHEEDIHPRGREMRAITSVLGGNAALLAGDMNTPAHGDEVGTPPAGVHPRAEAVPGAPRTVLAPLAQLGYVDCYRALHPDDPGYTYAPDHPWLRIDYLLASPGLARRLRACEVVRNDLTELASDHLPVWAEFA